MRVRSSIVLLFMAFLSILAGVPRTVFSIESASDTLSPDADALLKKMGGGPKPPQSISAQRAALAGLKALTGAPEPVYAVSNIQVPGPRGLILVRLYRPSATTTLPLLVWFHSGSWVKGDLELEDVQLRAIANRSGWMIASVDYRLAPEHPFPAATDDAWAAVTWLAANAAQVGADPRRIAIGGNSAGGNLAAIVAQRAATTGDPRLIAQILVHPALDLTLGSASWGEFGDRNYVVGREEMLFNLQHYLPPGVDRRDQKVSPFFATLLKGIPSTLIFTAGSDPMRDEGEAYANRLRSEGVSVDLTRYPGMVHGFFLMAGVLEDGRRSIEQIAAWLRARP